MCKEAARKLELGGQMSVYHVPHRRSLPRRKEKYVGGPIASTSSSVLLKLTCRTRLPKTWPSRKRRLERFNFIIVHVVLGKERVKKKRSSHDIWVSLILSFRDRSPPQ